MLKIYAVFTFLCIFFLCGCHTPSLKDTLLKEEAQYYSIFAPASIEFTKYEGVFYSEDMRGMVDEVQAKKNSPEELDKYLKKMTEMREPYHPEFFPTNKDWIEFKQKAEDAQVYFYERKTPTNKQENGFLIVRDDKIIYRHVIEAPPTK